MSPEISPQNSLDGYWGMSIGPFSSTNSNITNNQSEIYSNSPTDTTSSSTEEHWEIQSNFDVRSPDWTSLLCETDLARAPADEKKRRILESIEKLKTEKLFSELQIDLRTIETVAMSPKISDLSKYYVRYYDNMKTSDIDPEKPIRYTELSLESLQEYLQTLYPEERILSVNGKFEEPFLKNLFKTEEGKPAYILYQVADSEYKMLLVFQLKDKKFHLNVLSSLGVNICQESKYSPNVDYICRTFLKQFGNQLKYNDSYEKRQEDESNCSAIIIDDMRIARELIAKGQSFNRYKNGPLAYEFLKVCKAGIPHDELDFVDKKNWSWKSGKETNGYIEKKHLLPMSKQDATPLNRYPVLVNTKATLLSLKILEYFVRNKAVFTPSSVKKVTI